MAVFLQATGSSDIWITNGLERRQVLDREELNMLAGIGVAPNKVSAVTAPMLARIPVYGYHNPEF